MHRAGGDQEMVVLSGGPAIRVLLGREGQPRRSARIPVRAIIAVGLDAFPQAQINAGVRPGIEQVVAFVLRVVHPEMLLDVFGERMHLERKIAAAHRVEEVEPDGKLIAEPRVDRFAEQRARLVEDQIERRDLEPDVAKPSNRLFSSGTQSKHQP